VVNPGNIKKKLKDDNIEEGDLIEITVKKGIYKGILMPHHEASTADILTIKLDTGYNIGIAVDDKSEISLLEKGKYPDKKSIEPQIDESKPKIAILGTGGTIASYVDYRTGAVHPAQNARDLAISVPELARMCNIKAKVLFSMLSEDIKSEHWQEIARESAYQLNNGASGVIITHGTDTMSYTSCALSFMLKNPSGPVILVGSQRSSDRPSTDANINLISATQVATESDLAEVVVMMYSSTSDSQVSIHRGTRVRKMHTSKRNAFLSINENPLGRVQNGKITISEQYHKRGEGPVKVMEKMETKVGLVYTYPGINSELIDFIAEKNKGIVIAGSGLGHTPLELLESIRNAISNGIHIVMTSQCIYGRVNMNVYSTGRDLMKAGVISAEDMLPETAYVKLMWVLGQTHDPEKVAHLIKTNIAGEIKDRRTF
jgi:glutamyl-tRNA(Gln) amidotransferase subunit D